MKINMMKKTILFLFLLCLSTSLFAQSKKKVKEWKAIFKNSSYGRISNISFENRMKNYPFSKASKIQIVSFDQPDGQILPGTKLYDNTPKLKFSWLTPFFERRTLKIKEIDELTDLLYNFCHKKDNFISEQASCFNPKNAILFLDMEDEVFAFWMICFECKRIKVFDSEISCDCDHKIKALESFFKKQGIEFGITKGVKN